MYDLRPRDDGEGRSESMHATIRLKRRRLLTRMLAFCGVVCYGILVLEGINAIGGRIVSDDGSDDGGAPRDRIRAVPGPSSRNDSSVRISFSLHDPLTVPFRSAFAQGRCVPGDLPEGGVRAAEIPPSLLAGAGLFGLPGDNFTRSPGLNRLGRVLDFTATVSTDLKILQLGDSVTLQMAQSLDEMLGAVELGSRRVLWDAFPGGEGGTVVAPTRGGGMHGAWRITALLSRSGQGLPDTRNKPGGGWNFHQWEPFKTCAYSYNGRNATVGSVDAVVFRVMQGWMRVEDITRERVTEAAELAGSIMGADTVVFVTVPHTNNVLDVETMEAVRGVNEMIRDVARSWHLNRDNRTTLLVMEYGKYSDHVIWRNARHLGYNVSDPLDADDRTFAREGPGLLLERLTRTPESKFVPTVAQTCARRPPPESGGTYCDRNYLFRDGMHMCTESLASRVGAGLACLLGCSYNGGEGSRTGDRARRATSPSALEERMAKIRACEHECNEQFMSVKPVRESWIDAKGGALASFSDF